MTHNVVIDGIVFAWGRLVSEVMSCAVDAEHKVFLERPSGDITHELFIPGLLATGKRKVRVSEK
jgi:hypothetical protein